MNFRAIKIAFALLLAPLSSHAFITNDVLEVENAFRIKDINERVQQYRRLAEKGNTYAMVNLGVAYQIGSGVPKDQAEANRLYQQAASLGNPHAMKALGNYDAALKVLLKESDSGNGNSSYGIALMYMFGKGVQQSNQETTRWLRKASDQGSMNASYMLGLEYKGTDREEAIRLFRKAGSLGHGGASAMVRELEASPR